MFPQENILNQTRPRRLGDRRDEILELLRRTPGFAGGTLQEQIDRTTREGMERFGEGTMNPNAALAQTDPQRDTQPTFQAAPEGITLSTGQETRPWKAGYGVGESDPLKREAARIRAMIENPTSNVLPGGQVETPHPMGRGKAALLGALFGLAQGDRDTTLAERLAAGGTGALIGGVAPRKVQEWRRRMEVQDAQGQLATQQKLGLGQAQLESEQAETRQRQLEPEIKMIEAERKARYDAERIRIQREVAEGRKSIADANREMRQLELEERKRHNLETERQARERPVSSEAAEGEAIATSTQEAANTLKTELDQHKGQLMENERAITTKEAWWNREAARRMREAQDPNSPNFNPDVKLADVLLQVKAEDPDYASGGHDTLLNNTKALRDAIKDKQTEYDDMLKIIRSGRAKGARGGGRPVSKSYAGRTMTRANLERYAKDKGISVEEAQRQVESMGVKVQ